MKTTLRIALTLLFCVTLFLCLSSAAFADYIDSGKWGDLEWTLDENYTLTISGSGPINDFDIYSTDAWRKYISNIKTIIIENGVTSIGNRAFYSCGLTSIIIPEGVTSIGNRAFSNCSSLASITIPEGVTSIGSNAFSCCYSLASITVLEGVTSIGSDAFSYCYSLASITIPESVTSIDDYAFDDCNNLTDVYYGGTSIEWCSINIKVPNEALFNATIHFADVIYDFSDSGTWGDLNWTLHIHDDNGALTISGNGAMNGFSQNSSDAWLKYKSCISSVSIENGVTSIGDSAFYNCGLTSITIPEGVTSIGYTAFSFCTSLASITIPESVTSIGYSAFYYCNNLTDVYYGGTNVQWFSISMGGRNVGLYNATIHFTDVIYDFSDSGTWGNLNWTLNVSDESLALTILGNGDMNGFEENINDAWLKYKSCISSVSIENGVTSIGDYAFYDCECLTSITIPEGVTSIGDYAFSHCSSLTSIKIPESVNDIGYQSFNGCTSLTNINIPDGVTEIKNFSFNACTSLTNVIIPRSVRNICPGAFAGCTSITSISIPEGVTWIDIGAFRNCTSLTSVTIPSSVTHIGYDDGYNDSNGAFRDCSALKEIRFLGVPPTISNYAFMNVTANAYYPTNKGWTADNMKNHGGNLTWIAWTPENYTISYSANNGSGAPANQIKTQYSALTISSIIPSRTGYYFIGWAENPTATDSMYIPGDSFTKDANTTLYAVWAQPDFVLPVALTTIEENAFENCPFRFAALSENTVDIRANAFLNCQNMKYILIPADNVAINKDAFAGIEDLTILGASGSNAENFATQWGYNYVPTQ